MRTATQYVTKTEATKALEETPFDLFGASNRIEAVLNSSLHRMGGNCSRDEMEGFQMKQCSQCTKAATFHITEIRKGVAKPIHLCEGCAKEYLALVDVSSKPTATLAKHKGLKLQDSPSDHLVCSHCGQTFRQFRSQGRIGCAHDYELFRDELLQLLESIHGNTQHMGKVPRRHAETGKSEARLLRLRGELKSAIDAEDYEKAAELRDQIFKIEQAEQQSPPETKSTAE